MIENKYTKLCTCLGLQQDDSLYILTVTKTFFFNASVCIYVSMYVHKNVILHLFWVDQICVVTLGKVICSN